MKISPQFVACKHSNAKPGSLVRTADHFGIVATSPQDPANRRSLALFVPDPKGSHFKYHYSNFDIDVVDIGTDFVLQPDVQGVVSTGVLPSRDSGHRLFASEGNFYFVVGLEGSHEYRLLDIASGALVVDRGTPLTSFARWKIGVLGPEHTVHWVLAPP